MHRSRILGIGMSVPKKVVTNHDLSKLMETSHEWIVERSGIEERRWVSEGETGASLATAASQEAIKKAGLEPKDIDLLIYATLSPDYNFPGTGVFVQRNLGIKNIPCIDIRQQCTGFIYALSIADQYIRSGMMKHVLVIGSEVHSTGLDISTAGRDVTVLFGDGAGAAVLGRATDEQHMILSSHIHADGTEAEILWTEYPASAHDPRISAEAMAERKHYPVMNGKKVFKHAVTRMPEAIMEGMVANKVTLDGHRHGDPAPGEPAHQPDGREDDRPPRHQDAQQHPEVRQHHGRDDPDLHARGDRARQDQAGQPGRARRVRRRPDLGLGVPALLSFEEQERQGKSRAEDIRRGHRR
jgi:3-oxoacyl-[acyl-carrier-protein] synthase-3